MSAVLLTDDTGSHVCAAPLENGYRMKSPREGDVAKSWADASLARQLSGLNAKCTLEFMCVDARSWQRDLVKDTM